MDKTKIFNKLLADDFIGSKNFIRIHNEDQDCLGTTLVNSKGCEFTIAYQLYDNMEDFIELYIEIHNRCSLEQLKVIAQKLIKRFNKRIDIYENDDNSYAYVCIFHLSELEQAIEMMKCILEEVNNVIIFLIK